MKRILAIVPDLLIEVRIVDAAKQMNAVVETMPATEAKIKIASGHPDLVIADIVAIGREMGEVVSTARTAGVPVIGFYPHVDAALRDAAKGAGIERVYPRSRFLRNLPAIVREALGA